MQGVSTGARIIHTTRTAAYDAKNRFDLPAELPLSWPDFWAAVKAHRPADPKALAAECARKAKIIGGETETKTTEFLAQYGTNAAVMARFNDRLNAILGTKAEQAEV